MDPGLLTKNIFFVVLIVWFVLWWGFFLVAKLILERIPSRKYSNRNIMNTIFIYALPCFKNEMEDRLDGSGYYSNLSYHYIRNLSTLCLYYSGASSVYVRYRLRIMQRNGIIILIVSQKGLPWTAHQIYHNIDGFMKTMLGARPVSLKYYSEYIYSKHS